jgi:hypothetical protein
VRETQFCAPMPATDETFEKGAVVDGEMIRPFCRAGRHEDGVGGVLEVTGVHVDGLGLLVIEDLTPGMKRAAMET